MIQTIPGWRSRLTAAGLHLLVSAAVAMLVAWAVFSLWFPGDFRLFSGGATLFGYIVGVDLAMGPLITLVVFDRRKPLAALRRDLLMVGLLQLAALGYGLQVLTQARPVVVALEVDRLRVVSAGGVLASELPRAPEALRSLSLTGPVWVLADRAVLKEDAMEQASLAMAGYDLGARPATWRAWDALARESARQVGRPLSLLSQRPASEQAALRAALAGTGQTPDRLVFLPMITHHGDWIALLDARSGEWVAFAEVNGWDAPPLR